MKRFAAFAGAVVVICGGAAWLAVLLSQDALVERAVVTSAGVAAFTQLASFGVAKALMARKVGLFGAWGGAMAVRFAALVVYALLVFKVLALVPAPALVSFAVLLLLTSVIEPVFLNA
ncbi:MAG: hypothetical protein FJ202_11190 [Gemmatimonadetes bacterium]|nr:hypothetical protein [Gemmatimonadota bacterium]MBM4438559.1 hypothetical protein [Actinomycetota bacterium]